MKRWLSLLLALLMCFGLVSCGGPDPIILAPGVKHTIEDALELSLVSITSTTKVTATMGSGLYYDNPTEGFTFIDAIFDVTNLSTKAIYSDDLLKAVATNGDKDVFSTVLYCVETNNMSYVSEYESIDPMETVRFHAAISLPASETDLRLTYTAFEQPFIIDYTVGTSVKNTTPLAIDQVIGDEETSTIQYLGYKISDNILPSNTEGVYAYYDVDDADNTYLALSFEVTNYQGEKQDMESFVYCKALFQDKYEYTGFIITEEDDGTGFDSFGSIDPLSPTHLLCVIEVPDAVADFDFTVSVYSGKQEYVISK